MSDRYRITLLVALLFSIPAYAESGLQGLEMDVMNAGENATRATARIALPRMAMPAPAEQDLPGLDAERNARAAELRDANMSVAREAAPLPETNTATEAINPPR